MEDMHAKKIMLWKIVLWRIILDEGLLYAFFEIASMPISTLNSKVDNVAKSISKFVKYLFKLSKILANSKKQNTFIILVNTIFFVIKF